MHAVCWLLCLEIPLLSHECSIRIQSVSLNGLARIENGPDKACKHCIGSNVAEIVVCVAFYTPVHFAWL